MINPVTVYEVICDDCGWSWDAPFAQNWWTSTDDIQESLDDGYSWAEIDGKHYCGSCARKRGVDPC